MGGWEIPFCPNCGREVAVDVRFCSFCGVALTSTLPDQARIAYLQGRLAEIDNARGMAIKLGIVSVVAFGIIWNVILHYDFGVGLIIAIVVPTALFFGLGDVQVLYVK